MTAAVRRGVQAAGEAPDVVLVHDGVRPFVAADLVDRVDAAARDGPVVPVVRTVPGDRRNRKITVPEDLKYARRWVARHRGGGA